MKDKNSPAEHNSPVEQPSRLSEHSWKRHLPHFQLSAGYYFITFSTYNRQPLQSLQKDCVFNAIRFFDNTKYELYAAVILNDHVHMVLNPKNILRLFYTEKQRLAIPLGKEGGLRVALLKN